MIKDFEHSFFGQEFNGLKVLMTHMKNSQNCCRSLSSFIKERITLEEEYGKRLLKMSKSLLFSEVGSLGHGLETLKAQMESSAQQHLDLSSLCKKELDIPLAEFINKQSEKRRFHRDTVEKWLRERTSLESTLVKAKEKYESKSIELTTTQTAISRTILNSKDLEKLKLKVEKLVLAVSLHEQEYKATSDKLLEVHAEWELSMRRACIACEDLEKERIQFLREKTWHLTNLFSDLYVKNDECCETIRKSLEKIDIEKDLQLFLSLESTGSDVPQPLVFTPFSPKDYSEAELLEARKVSSSSSIFSALGFSKPSSSLSLSLSSKSSSVVRLSSSTTSNVPTTVPSNDINSTTNTSNTVNTVTDKEYISKTNSLLYNVYDVNNLPPIKFTVRVLYDYHAQAPEELEIFQGQVLSVFKTHDDGWWEAIGLDENGKRRKGLFPSNFTEMI